MAKATKAPKLGKYKEKRNFGSTPEPAGKVAQTAGASFVVQEHHARRHHFDFRLEIDGVLVSWAVPKGIPEGKASKRLAVHVEDHPLEYGSFEGVIPKGNYGAGTVAIWDKGTWEPSAKTWRKDFAAGKLKFYLHGTRLQGEYLLARMDDEPNWLIRRIGDDVPAVAEELQHEKPEFLPFQLAKVVPSVPSGADWIHELKLDGYRLMAIKHRGKVTLYTRNGHDWTDKFGTLAEHIGGLTSLDFILDGEAVVFDHKGKTSFGLLQEALGVRSKKCHGVEISFVAFDILHLDGFNLRPLPLSARLKHLDNILTAETGTVRRSKFWDAQSGASLFEQSCKLELEGIISKRLSRPYASDLREWTKSKCRPRQEFVVCGYTPPKSSLPAFGSLVLGSYEDGKLVSRGKVGTGFSDELRRTILARMKPLRSGKELFRIDDKDVEWLKPQLVAEVEYAEITREGSVRQAGFVGLREDKAPKDVHLDGLQTAAANQKGVVVSGITISNPDRLVYPAEGIIKLELVQYFERTAELMLPYLINRPLALLRAPDGVNGETFFQKTFTTHQPPGAMLKRISPDAEVIHIKDAKGLVALAQFGMVELHPWGSRLPDPEKPDFLIWDLDPDSSVPWKEVLGAAFLLRDLLGNLGLSTMVKTSGGKGLHIQMPVRPTYDWDTLREFSKVVSSAVAAMNPNRFTVTSTKSKRTGKIYIDWMRNGRGATCIAPWCPRIRPGAPVSMPIAWEDLPALEPGGGFTIKHPPQEPHDWMNPIPQRISKVILREFDL